MQVEPGLVKASMTPLDLGLEGQKVFHAVGVFCHGFLAGLAFWHLVIVSCLDTEHTTNSVGDYFFSASVLVLYFDRLNDRSSKPPPTTFNGKSISVRNLYYFASSACILFVYCKSCVVSEGL